MIFMSMLSRDRPIYRQSAQNLPNEIDSRVAGYTLLPEVGV
jgi:hypothetical protein